MSLLKSLSAIAAATFLLTAASHGQAVTDVVGYTGGTYSQTFSTLPTTTASVAPASPVAINGVTYTLPAADVPYAFDNTTLGLTGTSAPASLGGSAMAGWWATCVANNKLGANPGDSTTGGIISFGANTGTTTRALGLITTSSTGLGYFGAAIENQTGSPISTIDLGFTAELWHQGASKPLAYGYVVDNGDSLTLVTASTSASLVTVGSASLTAAATGSLDGTQAANQVPVSEQNLVLSTPLQAGGVLWVMFDYSSTTGSSQGWGIANFTFSQGASAPVVSTEPSNVIANSGASASFTVVATGSGDTYQWYTGTPPGGSPISLATSATYTIPSVAAGNAGSYYVVVTDSVGSTASTAATLTVNSVGAAAITTEPLSQTIVVGNPVTFAVVATGTPAPTYQWAFNGTAIPGATSASYLISGVATANAGSYAVTASNAGGSVTSTGATLTVDVVPSLTTQPSGAAVLAGQSVTLTAAATGNPAPTFQWSFGGTALPGATSSTYTVAYASPATAGAYTVVATNAAGSATSSAATLGLSAISDVVSYSSGTYSQTFSTLPYDLAPVGTATTTSVNAANPVTVNGVTYTLPAANVPFAFDDTTLGAGTSIGGTAMAGWYGVGTAGDQFGSQYGDQTTGGVIGFGPSAGSARSLGLIATSSSGGTAFGVAIQNNTGGSISSINLAFTEEFWKQGTHTNPLLYGYTVDNGATLNLALAATASAGVNLGSMMEAAGTAAGPVDGTNPANQDPVSLPSLALTPALQPGGILWITAQMPTVVSGAQGFSIANFSFSVAGTVPTFTASPAGQSVTAGQAATFTAAATGNPSPSYQWSVNGSAIAGATSSTYVTGAATAAMNGFSYAVTAINGIGSAVTSTAAVLTVDFASSITAQPSAQTVTAPAAATFSVAASGNPAAGYQWSVNGTAIAGATSASYTTPVTSGAFNGNSYSVAVSNGVGSTVVSSAASLTVFYAPAVSTQPQGSSLLTGQTVTFTAAATGNPAPTYQWELNGTSLTNGTQVDGSSVGGATTPTLTVASLHLADAGTYSVVVGNSAGSAASNGAILVVNASVAAPSFTTGSGFLQPSSQTVTAPAAAVFTASASGTLPSYQWFFAGSAIAGATSSTYTTGATSPASAGGYLVVASNSAGSATSATATLTVNAAPVIVTQPSIQTVAFGSTVSFSVVVSGLSPTYQWSFGGTAIAGANSASYAVVNATQSNDGTYAVTASNAAGSTVSAGATLTVGLPNLTYFGSFGTGQFALNFTGTGTGTLFAYDPNSGLLIGQYGFTVSGNGTFTVTGTTGGGTAAAGSGPTADVAAPFTLTGVASGGGVTGTITGISGLTTFASSGGSHPSSGGLAGVYQTGQIGGSGTTTYVVSGDGDVFALIQTATGAVVGSGTVNGSGVVTIAATSSPSVSITGTIASNSTAAAVVTTSGVTSAYSGGTRAALATVSIASSVGSAEVGAGDNAAIAGFVVAGTARPVLVLGLGPQLASVTAAPVLQAPFLQLFQGGTGPAIDANAGWNLTPGAGAQSASALQSAATVYDPSITLSTAGTSSGGDCGILTTSTGPGVYTAVLRGGTGTGQVGELDVYDTGSVSSGQSLTNTSLRGTVPAGGSLVDQFTVKSSDGSPARLLIRAVGPGLSAFTNGGSPLVNAALLSNPTLTVYNSQGVVQGSPNKGWINSPDGTNGVTSNLATTAASVGAFALTTASADSALIISLAPGTYTASATSTTNQAGVVLIEVYQLP